MKINIEQIAKEEMAKTEKFMLQYPWEDPYAYAMWLAQTYYMVSHSTRLVALAGACVKLGSEKLHARFVDHSREERGHQVVCVSDIQALGFELNDFPKTFQAQAMYQIQYYWIQFQGAASFFGYTLALECLAEQFGPQLASRVLKAHGPKASKFLKLHSEDDQDHTQQAYQHLRNLSAEDSLAVKQNLILSAEIYRSMLIDLGARLRDLNVTKHAA